jgi:hypothetical protein
MDDVPINDKCISSVGLEKFLTGRRDAGQYFFSHWNKVTMPTY